MKTAVISDIHGNLEALQATLESIDAMDIGRTVCLGDIVGYGADPDACVELIQKRNIPSVIGNHDMAVTGGLSTENFSILARSAAEWTRSVISKEHASYLAGLPYTIERDDALFVHSSPDLPNFFRYILNQNDAALSFDAFDTGICFIGHTHRPSVFCEDGSSAVVSKGNRFIVNVGSVGQPRDGDRRACFLVFDHEQFSIEYFRVDYDIESAASKIIAAGLPQKLADRLRLGI